MIVEIVNVIVIGVAGHDGRLRRDEQQGGKFFDEKGESSINGVEGLDPLVEVRLK